MGGIFQKCILLRLIFIFSTYFHPINDTVLRSMHPVVGSKTHVALLQYALPNGNCHDQQNLNPLWLPTILRECLSFSLHPFSFPLGLISYSSIPPEEKCLKISIKLSPASVGLQSPVVSASITSQWCLILHQEHLNKKVKSCWKWWDTKVKASPEKHIMSKARGRWEEKEKEIKVYGKLLCWKKSYKCIKHAPRMD